MQILMVSVLTDKLYSNYATALYEILNQLGPYLAHYIVIDY